MTHTYAELMVSEKTYNEIASKLRVAGYDHAFIPGEKVTEGSIGRDVIDMHGIGLIAQQAPKLVLLKLVGTGDENLQHAADTVYQLALTHMTAGLRIANRLRKEAVSRC
mgnify:CR=1 FL=1